MRLYTVPVDGPPVAKRLAVPVVRWTLAQLPVEHIDRLRRRMWAGAPVELSGRVAGPDGAYGCPMVEALPWDWRREVLAGAFPATWDWLWLSMLAKPGTATVGQRGAPTVLLNPTHVVPIRWPGEKGAKKSYLSHGSALQSLTYEDVRGIAQRLCGAGDWPHTGTMARANPKLQRRT